MPLSIWELFRHADQVVQVVMIGLLIASIWVWAIAIDKVIIYRRARRTMDRFEQMFWSGQSLDELYRSLSARSHDSMPALFLAAMRVWKRSLEGQVRSFSGLHLRFDTVIAVTRQRKIDRLE